MKSLLAPCKVKCVNRDFIFNTYEMWLSDFYAACVIHAASALPAAEREKISYALRLLHVFVYQQHSLYSVDAHKRTPERLIDIDAERADLDLDLVVLDSSRACLLSPFNAPVTTGGMIPPSPTRPVAELLPPAFNVDMLKPAAQAMPSVVFWAPLNARIQATDPKAIWDWFVTMYALPTTRSVFTEYRKIFTPR